MKWHSPLTLAFVVSLLTAPLPGGDWPQFRYDAGRTAAAPHELPAELRHSGDTGVVGGETVGKHRRPRRSVGRAP